MTRSVAPRRPTPGHSLIELVTVVMVIAILVGVAAPTVLGRNDDAAIDATVSHLRTIELAAELCFNETGAWPADAARGVMPAAFSGYLRPNLFATPCPCGGVYDWGKDYNGVAASIAIVDASHDINVWREIDHRMDDGDLTTGRVTKVINRLQVTVAY